MNKKITNEPKKVLVRNTTRSVPKTTVMIAKTKGDEKLSSGGPLSSKSQVDSLKTQQFRYPQLNSALTLSKKIDLVENLKPAKTKSAPALLALDEKVTRQVNFSHDKAIYKDLIPLEGPTKLCTTSTSREPLPLKDKEPNLDDFIEDRQVKEYLYKTKLKIDDKPPNSDDFNSNLRLYRLLQNYTVEDLIIQ